MTDAGTSANPPGESDASGRIRRPRVAFVVQRCGRDVNGGAELHCRLIAERMRRHWDIEILTTCALDYMTWADHYPEGLDETAGLRIRRFRVDRPRDVETFNALSAELHRSSFDATLEQQEAWMRAQRPDSTALLDHIKAVRNDFDLFIFFGYLYAQTYFGLPAVADKAILLPLAHDEWTIRLSMWDRFFESPVRFIFNSEEELAFLKRRFPRAGLAGEIVGIGLTPPAEKLDPWRFRAATGIFQPYLLYVGRIDPSKGCDTLFEWYLRARRTAAIPHKLVLMGKPVMPIPVHPDIIPLGFVDDAFKFDALAGCDWLLMPSEFESLSFAVLEAWSAGRPVLVNGSCEVLAGNCRRSNGGLPIASYHEWLSALLRISPGEKTALGQNGRCYVRTRYTWQVVEAQYQHAFACATAPAANRAPVRPVMSTSPRE